MKHTSNEDEYKVEFTWRKMAAVNDNEHEKLLKQQMEQLESLEITMRIAEKTQETADQPAVYMVEFSTE